jgi:hypothetical protein
MTSCRSCGAEVESRYRFCPWCATPVRRKLVEFFRPHPRDSGRALRVSWYLDDEPHVRFSVWDESGKAEAALSLDIAESERLGHLLVRRAGAARRVSFAERLAAFLR